MSRLLPLALVVVSAGGLLAGSSAPPELAGVWHARRGFGPEARGELEVRATADGWLARIAGLTVEVPTSGDAITFELPDDRGSFRGRRAVDGDAIVGQWIQPPMLTNGTRYATPVRLEPAGPGLWRGEVTPVEDRFTMYLVLAPREDGSLGAFIRNPERNIGVFVNADRLTLKGDRVELIGRWFRSPDEQVLADGLYRPDFGHLSLYIPRGRGTYDFERLEDDAGPGFRARGRAAGTYRYRPPMPAADGWQVGTLEAAGISFEPIRRLVETEIDPPATSLHDSYIHGLLIARHGKLVFEDYFHGYDRLTPHDTRSASKSLTAALVGAAIEAGEPLELSSPVYETAYRGELPEDLEPRKRRMTVEHLLTMSPGFDCDDRDPSSPGNEDAMWEQTDQPDFYQFTLALPMVRDPGESAVYCSASPNLLGAVLESSTGEALPELMARLLAGPLDMGRYHMNLTPSGHAYMGGGIWFLPRDFMKLGQLFLDGGVWRGRRIVSREFAQRALSPLYEMRELRYGYLWWVIDLPYQDRTVRAFFAGGNGGQVVMGVPELDLLVAVFAGNYSDRVMYRIQEELIPTYILPAVDGGAP